jgi:hypothetical protein
LWPTLKYSAFTCRNREEPQEPCQYSLSPGQGMSHGPPKYAAVVPDTQHRSFNHSRTPAYAHNKMISSTYTRTLLQVSAINCHPQTEANTTEYIMLIHQVHMYNVKNTHQP